MPCSKNSWRQGGGSGGRERGRGRRADKSGNREGGWGGQATQGSVGSGTHVAFYYCGFQQKELGLPFKRITLAARRKIDCQEARVEAGSPVIQTGYEGGLGDSSGGGGKWLASGWLLKRRLVGLSVKERSRMIDAQVLCSSHE